MNLFKFLGVLCVFALGYITIVGTSSDDLNPSETEGVELLNVTVDESGPQPLNYFGDCWNTSLEAEFGDSLGDVTIDLKGAYAKFVPTSIVGGSGVTCVVTISGVTIAEVFRSGTTPNILTSADFITLGPVNQVLANPGVNYNFCGACEGSSGTTSYNVNIFSGVTANFTYNIL